MRKFKITVALETEGVSEVVTAEVSSDKILKTGVPDYLAVLTEVIPHLNLSILESIYKTKEKSNEKESDNNKN